METVIKSKLAEVYSKSNSERDIEVKFTRRLFHLFEVLKVSDKIDGVIGIHQLVNSGDFNRIFPALGDEGPVPPNQFKDLKPFDYQDWGKRSL